VDVCEREIDMWMCVSERERCGVRRERERSGDERERDMDMWMCVSERLICGCERERERYVDVRERERYVERGEKEM